MKNSMNQTSRVYHYPSHTSSSLLPSSSSSSSYYSNRYASNIHAERKVYSTTKSFEEDKKWSPYSTANQHYHQRRYYPPPSRSPYLCDKYQQGSQRPKSFSRSECKRQREDDEEKVKNDYDNDNDALQGARSSLSRIQVDDNRGNHDSVNRGHYYQTKRDLYPPCPSSSLATSWSTTMNQSTSEGPKLLPPTSIMIQRTKQRESFLPTTTSIDLGTDNIRGQDYGDEKKEDKTSLSFHPSKRKRVVTSSSKDGLFHQNLWQEKGRGDEEGELDISLSKITLADTSKKDLGGHDASSNTSDDDSECNYYKVSTCVSEQRENIKKGDERRLNTSHPSSVFPLTPRCHPDVTINPSLSVTLAPRSYCSSTRTQKTTKEFRQEAYQYNNGDDGAMLVGLENIGNTCFMNSALQCLIHTPSVQSYFIRGEYKKRLLFKSPSCGEIAERFAYLVNVMNQQPLHKAVNMRQFRETIVKWVPQFSGYGQHDAHEFLRSLIDCLAEDLNGDSENNQQRDKIDEMKDDALSKLSPLQQGKYWWSRHFLLNSSYITKVFCGQMISTTECTVCRNRYHCFDPFYDLSLPIPSREDRCGIIGTALRRRKNSRVEANECTLEQCLRNFSKEEILDGENMRQCSRCKKRQRSTKRLLVNKFPSILVFHLKRFSNSRRKLNTEVAFPLKSLDVSSLYYHNEDCNSSATHLKKPILYDLYALCNHTGSLHSGHYTA
uniref:Ubiquitin carboxyl-terminal hydrolase n=1 Tax=Ditylum brightwellii TaxID=49249 RepID=A0A7S4VHX8_9STRA